MDYLKKGVSMIATNARESIRFIDRIVSIDDSGILLETPEEVGPNWKRCLTYKIRSPKVQEFPNNKATSVSKPDTIKYENEDIADEDFSSGPRKAPRKQKAELPARLKYLIRPCIKKTHIDQENWLLITEDLPTKIWCESFGIKCVNIAGAESALFHSKHEINLESDPSRVLGKMSLNDSERKQSSSKKVRSKKGNDSKTRLESYDSISYAPRGSGELWVP